MRAALLALAACGGSSPPPPPPPPDHAHMVMGSSSATKGAHFATSCGDAAQPKFDAGFFSLHNMDYVRARAAFDDVAKTTPTCAIAFWGIAMTYFQPLWPGQPTKDAIAAGAAAVASARAAKASAVETDYIAAVAAFYADGDYAARLVHWAAAQKQVAEKYPEDVEAQAFSALARLATLDKKDKTYAEQRAVAQSLEKLLAQRPEHPGLLHYLVHAYDNPALAQAGVEVARKYGLNSPEAAHALHMPSHIYTRLGNWSESIASNLKSADAALKHPGDGGKVSRDFIHASDYLTYAYLQLGDDTRAHDAMAKLDPATAFEPNSGPGAYGLAAAPARYALERHDWKAAAALVVKAVPYDWDHYPWAEAVTHAARGLGAARSNDAKLAAAEIAELDRLRPLVEAAWWKGRLEIERDVIAAWVAHDRHDDATAEKLLHAASDRELAAGKDNVEPGHVITAAEQYAELLVELKRPKEAIDVYAAALEESPHRFDAVYGAGHAAELANQPDVAKTYYKQLVDMVPSSPRPELALAQAWLAKH